MSIQRIRVPLTYVPLRCQSGKRSVDMGLVGVVELDDCPFAFFGVVRTAPPKLEGFDAFELGLLRLLPDAVKRDFEALATQEPASQEVNSRDLLDLLTKQYRGTVFAGERNTAVLTMRADRVTEHLWPSLARKAFELFETEVVEPTAPKRKTHQGKTQAKRAVSAALRSALQPSRIPVYKTQAFCGSPA